VANEKKALFWSIALPGFGQVLNGKYIKGILFILLEIFINVQANFNEIIMLSFLGDIEKAIVQADYQWLMFYPCLYFFSIWDAWKDAGGGKNRHSFIPFVITAYFVSVGCIYSSKLKLFGILFGPVWLPMFCVIPGLVFGLILKELLRKRGKYVS
jgi:hypothetical protein